LDIRKPKELKRGEQCFPLLYAVEGRSKANKYGKRLRGYAPAPPIRSNNHSGSGKGCKGQVLKGVQGMTGGEKGSIYLDHLECGGFGRGKCSDIPKSITAL